MGFETESRWDSRRAAASGFDHFPTEVSRHNVVVARWPTRPNAKVAFQRQLFFARHSRTRADDKISNVPVSVKARGGSSRLAVIRGRLSEIHAWLASFRLDVELVLNPGSSEG